MTVTITRVAPTGIDPVTFRFSVTFRSIGFGLLKSEDGGISRVSNSARPASRRLNLADSAPFVGKMWAKLAYPVRPRYEPAGRPTLEAMPTSRPAARAFWIQSLAVRSGMVSSRAISFTGGRSARAAMP